MIYKYLHIHIVPVLEICQVTIRTHKNIIRYIPISQIGQENMSCNNF